jgi:hypothetical protein
MAQDHAGGQIGVAGEKRTQSRLIAVQDHVQPGMFRQGISQAGNNGRRPAIATHGVN